MKKELLQIGSKCVSKKEVIVFSDPEFDNFSTGCKHIKISEDCEVQITKLPFRHLNIQFIEFEFTRPKVEGKWFTHWITFKGGFNLIQAPVAHSD